MKLTVGFSPCPNDTFMFDAMIHHKIDTEGLEFEVVIADIDKLNKWGLQHKLNVTKLSFHAFTYCIDNYVLLDSGSALGRNCGPLLIKKPDTIFSEKSRILIPGKYTTANMLMSIAYPNYINKHTVLFSEIQDMVLKDEADIGLIIHEDRFTYKDRGLQKVLDLGEFWEKKTGLPIPLGGISITRKLSTEIQKKVERVLRKSIKYAFDNPDSSWKYVKSYAQNTDKEVIDSHIKLYVNNFSFSLGDKGKQAIEMLFKNTHPSKQSIFLSNFSS